MHIVISQEPKLTNHTIKLLSGRSFQKEIEPHTI